MLKKNQKGFGFLVVLIVIVVLAIAAVGVWIGTSGHHGGLPGFSAAAKTADPKDTDQVITASPVDPAQINFITKFRSCGGHEYFSTPDYNGQAEGDSNMKHYFYVADKYLGSDTSVKLYAPFDGKVHFMDIGGTGKGAVIEHQPFDGWYVVIYHVNPVVSEGATVKSGQLLGYDHLGDGMRSFDIALQRFKTEIQPTQDNGDMLVKNLESIFAHMDSSVASQWSAHGVTAANAVVDRAFRVTSPCQCTANQPQQPAGFKSNECYFDGSSADNVTLSV